MNNEDAYHLFAAYDESGRVKSIFDNSGAYDTVMEENNTIEITVGERDALVLSPDGFHVVNGTLVPHDPDEEIVLAEYRINVQLRVQRFATDARALLVGTDDPAKLAEYVDKAINAQAVIDGTASQDLIAEAAGEALSRGLENAAAVGEMWKAEAARLRGLRAEINIMERAAITAITAAQTAEAVRQAEDNALSTIQQWLEEQEQQS